MIQSYFILGMLTQLGLMLLFEHHSDALLFGFLLVLGLTIKWILDNRLFIRAKKTIKKSTILLPPTVSRRALKDRVPNATALNQPRFLLTAGRFRIELKRM